MSPESGPPSHDRVRVNIPKPFIPRPGELQISDSLVRDEPPAERPKRFSSTMDTPAEAVVEAAVEDPAIRDEILAGDASYRVAERDGRIYAVVGDKEADVTDLFTTGGTINRYRPERPEDPTSPSQLTDTLTIKHLSRLSAGPQKGKLSVNAVSQSGRPHVMGLEEIGWFDHERRRWRLPSPAETRR